MTLLTFPSAILEVWGGVGQGNNVLWHLLPRDATGEGWGGVGANNVPGHLHSRDAMSHVSFYHGSYVADVFC